MSQTVSELLVGVLEQIGVRHIFGLIGDSLNPLADAVRHSKIEWIGVRHEEGAALAAAGQAKLTGRLGVCAGTTGPGSNHLVAGLYEASRDHAPVLALSGNMPRKLQGTDFIQATEPDLLFRDVSLYTETISTAAQAPGVIHQAIAAAYAGPRRSTPDASSGCALGKGRRRPSAYEQHSPLPDLRLSNHGLSGECE
jgi:thiamine pyrophosphate-dependent acetolactate synthase large subunit-like protein